MTKTSALHAFALASTAYLGTACPAPTADQCDVGTEGCECTPGGACDPGLTCASNTCVDLGDGTTETAGSETTSQTTMEPGPTTSTDASDAESSDGSTSTADPCTDNGGELLADGFCFKQCSFDDSQSLPGNDLFGDCLELGMVCRSSILSGDYCSPDSWLSAECGSDADCDPGGVCVTRYGLDGVPAFSYCHIDCRTEPNCGTLHCVQECPSGLAAPIPYCDDVAPPYGTICCESYPDPC